MKINFKSANVFIKSMHIVKPGSKAFCLVIFSEKFTDFFLWFGLRKGKNLIKTRDIPTKAL